MTSSLRRLLCLAGALLAGAGLSGAAGAIDVRYGTWTKEGEAQYLGELKFKEVLEAESKGKFRVLIYPNNQLGSPRDMLTQLALNDTQMMASGDPGMNEIEYLSLPYLMRGIANYEHILASDIGAGWNKTLIEKRKVVLLGFLPRSPRQITANRVLKSMADLKGLKLRAPPRDYYVDSLSALGARPTPMEFSEVYTALQTGIVDGQENPIETIYAQKFHEVQKSVMMIDYIDKPAFVMVGAPFWAKLSEDERAMFRRALAAARAVVEQELPKQEKEFIAKMQAAGVVFTYPDKKPFIDVTQPVRDKLGTKVWGADLYKRIAELGQKQF